jgi:hypothetical protein
VTIACGFGPRDAFAMTPQELLWWERQAAAFGRMG